MELYGSTENTINLVLQYGIPALAALLVLGALAVVGKRWVVLWQTARGIVPEVIKSIDEPDDMLIKLINNYSPVVGAFIVRHGPALVTAIKDALDKLAEQKPEAPPVEVNIGGAVQ
jgi:hypothetical protein